MWGHSGSGVTSLLHEVAADPVIQASYPDGVYLVRLGAGGGGAALLSEVVALQWTLLQLCGYHLLRVIGAGVLNCDAEQIEILTWLRFPYVFENRCA